MTSPTIVFLLAIKICDTTPGQCRWSRQGFFKQEDACHHIGRSYLAEDTVFAYKCVIQMKEK